MRTTDDPGKMWTCQRCDGVGCANCLPAFPPPDDPGDGRCPECGRRDMDADAMLRQGRTALQEDFAGKVTSACLLVFALMILGAFAYVAIWGRP